MSSHKEPHQIGRTVNTVIMEYLSRAFVNYKLYNGAQIAPDGGYYETIAQLGSKAGIHVATDNTIPNLLIVEILIIP